MDNRPIGVFDSGLGGLTGVKELRKRLPHENIVYFGDTGRVPYGSRSPETILQYARQDIAFLLSKDVKCIMAACGTVSSTYPAAEAALETAMTGLSWEKDDEQYLDTEHMMMCSYNFEV